MSRIDLGISNRVGLVLYKGSYLVVESVPSYMQLLKRSQLCGWPDCLRIREQLSRVQSFLDLRQLGVMSQPVELMSLCSCQAGIGIVDVHAKVSRGHCVRSISIISQVIERSINLLDLLALRIELTQPLRNENPLDG